MAQCLRSSACQLECPEHVTGDGQEALFAVLLAEDNLEPSDVSVVASLRLITEGTRIVERVEEVAERLQLLQES